MYSIEIVEKELADAEERAKRIKQVRDDLKVIESYEPEAVSANVKSLGRVVALTHPEAIALYKQALATQITHEGMLNA